MKKNKRWIDSDFIRYISLFGMVGFIIIGNVFVTLFIYKLVEKYFFKSSILFIILILLGVVSGFYHVYRIIFPKK